MEGTGVLSCCFVLFFAGLVARSVASQPKEFEAFIGEDISLPCKVDEKQCGQLHSVKWYKDSNRVYVMRSAGKSRPEGDATNRMTVNYSPTTGNALLQINPVEADDEATYKCEITYLEVIENCDVVQIVKLKTLKTPESVKIHSGNGVPITNSTVIGPKTEGDEVTLICEASGGKPIPQVTWYNGSQVVQRAEFTSIDSGGGIGTGKSKLDLKLTRGDLLTNFECRVESAALKQPIVSWLQIDIHVRPTDISLTGVEKFVVQGSNVKLECKVEGARPAATVRWANGTYEINLNEIQTSTRESPIKTVSIQKNDGTFDTISFLEFKASHYENGRTIFCFAENEVMTNNSEPEIQASLILDVRYPPVITVKPPNVTVNESTEGNDVNVFLQCMYFANPQELKDAMWIKDGKNLTIDESKKSKYEGGSIVSPPLRILDVNREDMGEYSCSLRNEIGSDTSEDSIFLNVQYPPTVEVIMDPPTPLKAVDKGDVMLMCNVTSGNPASLLKVKWLLDGRLMKELPECDNSKDGGGEFCGLEPNFLNLTKVIQTYAGNYSCVGENLAGWGPESIPQELIVYYPPSPAQLRYFPSEIIKGASVTLECTVQDPGRPTNLTYLWYRGSHQMAEIKTWNFTLKSVRVEERSNFTCIATNEGGQSERATVYIDVNAPPSFITPLQKYQGVLYNSNNINLTCRVECSPICSIIWFKNGMRLNPDQDPLYDVRTNLIPADLQKNDFESIESTLIWNLTAWPGHMLDKFAPNSNYTCAATSNRIGPGVNSTIEIAIDYPPEDVKVTPQIVKVNENSQPDPVRCQGKGHPALTYEWKKNLTSAVIAHTEELALGPLKRDDSGRYICEASNKHGKKTSDVFFDVLFVPECSITNTEKNGNPALVCTANANPQEVIFQWNVQEGNETFTVESNIVSEGLRSYLILDSSIDVPRMYYCYVNNTVGRGVPCERGVAGNLPWWKQFNKDRLIILIASVIAVIIVVIILCIIIIMLCRRKRAETKYNNTLEMEEREKKVRPEPPDERPLAVSRKRKKPGCAPNPSSTEDKAKLGAAPPLNYTADPSNENDKQFYENLPFHGMQNPPNKPISIIAPFTQGNLTPNFTSSVISLAPAQNTFYNPLRFPDTVDNNKIIKRNQSFHGFHPTMFRNQGIMSYLRQQSSTSIQSAQFSRGVSNLSLPSLRNSNASLRGSQSSSLNDSTSDIRRTASGINPSNSFRESEPSRKLTTIPERRFSSLDRKKHRCYSPTFYSMRCKKHSKKRPIVVTLPKKCFSEVALASFEKSRSFENLTDSIQILEESNRSVKVEEMPVPAPRCRKHQKAIYANLQKSLETLHKPDKPISIPSKVQLQTTDKNDAKIDTRPKLVGLSPKIALSPTALKNSPVLKVSPNFIKPLNESPKGALSRQIKAKIKANSAPLSGLKDDDVKAEDEGPVVPQMPVLCSPTVWRANSTNQNAFYTLTSPYAKQTASVLPPQYSATVPHQKHHQGRHLLPKALFQQEPPLPKSKSFSSKSKQKKHHFQIPLQKCHSFKFQTAESYFQPIKNIHEENLMRNGYASDYPESSGGHHRRHHKQKHKQKTKGPLVVRRPSDYRENVHFQENIHKSVQLQYPQPMLANTNATNNGVVYADLDISAANVRHQVGQPSKRMVPTTEYATLNFNEVRQEIDV